MFGSGLGSAEIKRIRSLLKFKEEIDEKIHAKNMLKWEIVVMQKEYYERTQKYIRSEEDE